MTTQPTSILPPEVQQQLASYLRTEDTAAEVIGTLIGYAVDYNVSDILIDPGVEQGTVRIRIDGILHFALAVPLAIYPYLVSRVKVMSDLDITQHRLAQEGKIEFEHSGRRVTLRVAVAQVATGESAALRLHDAQTTVYTLETLGMTEPNLATHQRLLRERTGLLLTCGPTGSGKTSTLYSSLQLLNTGERNVISIEDPIEYVMPGINQMQVDDAHGTSFAEGLRVCLRLNPDTIFVGEIRDSETAHIAIEAALTGHLVLSTIHANSAAAIIFRLLDLQVERFFLNAALIGAVSQRLVRRVCPNCAREAALTPEEAAIYQKVTGTVLASQRVGQGCPACAQTGYRGRIGIFEVLVVDDTVRQLVSDAASLQQIEQTIQARGMPTLLSDGFQKAAAHLTTVQEVLTNAYTTV